VAVGWRRLHNEELHQILLGWLNDGRGMHHAREGWEMHTNFWSENLKGRDHSQDPNVDERIILGWILQKLVTKVWN